MKNCEKIYKYQQSCVSCKYDLTESRYITESHRVSYGGQKHRIWTVSTFCKSYFLSYGAVNLDGWVIGGIKAPNFAETTHHTFKTKLYNTLKIH